MTTIQLRPWQAQAITKSKKWLLEKNTSNRFVINAAPGSGKTICALVIAKELLENDQIDRVIVIAPSNEVVKQWAADAESVTSMKMMKVTGSDISTLIDYGTNYCATWQSLNSMLDAFHAVCTKYRTLIICDEQHHASSEASWGKNAIEAFHENGKYQLILTGTPFRSDGKDAVWLEVDKEKNVIKQPEDGSYVLTYGDAVTLEYCRPITFHRHEGNFLFDFEDGDVIKVSGKSGAQASDEQKKKLKRIKGIDKAMDFYNLATSPKCLSDNTAEPDLNSYMGTMAKAAEEKLQEVRYEMPNAGGLVIAPNIETAEHMAIIFTKVSGEKAVIVHSNLKNAQNNIKAFKNNTAKWLISVAMVSEGVDIPRLRVLAYLPNALTELFFRQAMGRVVRNNGPKDFSRAYVLIPAYEIFETYARRVEKEMSPKFIKQQVERPKKKICPDCSSECQINAHECSDCGHEFNIQVPQFETCSHCGQMNLMGAKDCQHCGKNLNQFSITLTNALRDGCIVKGLELSELEVRASELIKEDFEDQILAAGDEQLIKIVKSLPQELYIKIARISAQTLEKHELN